jgi:hypothetical protein
MCLARALESGQLSDHCGLRIWLNGERPVAIDPWRTWPTGSQLGTTVVAAPRRFILTSTNLAGSVLLALRP